MAKKSKIVKNDRRCAIVTRYAQRRAELKEIIRSPSSTGEQRAAARSELARQPRDASAVRLRNRDAIYGRPRGHLRKFGVSRLWVRQLAHNGQLPRRAEGELVMAKKRQRARRAAHPGVRSTKKNLLAGLRLRVVDYTDTAVLRVFISERGKIRSRYVTGLTRPTTTAGHRRDQERARNGAIALPRTERRPLIHARLETPARGKERILQ